MKEKIVFICQPNLTNFLPHIMESMSEKYEVSTCFGTDIAEIQKAILASDIVWLEWANETAVAVSKMAGPLHGKRVICRVHSYEILDGACKGMNWNSMHTIIFVSEQIKKLAIDLYPEIVGSNRDIRVIPNGIDLTKFNYKQRKSGVDIAFVAHLSHKKGLMLLLHAFNALPDQYNLHILGDWQDIRYKLYVTHIVSKLGLEDRVSFGDWIEHSDIPVWLNDKDYIVCTSPFEGQGMGVLEAMAMGIKPLVHDFPGAADIYPEDLIWTSIEDFVKQVVSDGYASKYYRDLIEIYYDKDKTNSTVMGAMPPPVIKALPKKEVPDEVFLSVCLIVKNEEANLRRCLQSVVNLADQIVVVDTGSTDKTMDIAREFGAEVYEHPWEEDFAKHRNQSISYATGNWVMIIDADEEWIDGVNFKRWLSIISNDYNGVAINIKDMEAGRVVLDFNVPKVFRAGEVKYECTVHNVAVIKGVAALYPEAYIKHYGYDITPEQKEAKSIRTMTMLRARLEKDPFDYKVHFFLSQAYGFYFPDDLDSLIKHAKEYISHKNEVEEFNYSIYFSLIQGLMRNNEPDAAYAWISMAKQLMPDDLDIAMAQTEFGVWVQNADIVIDGAKEFVRIYKLYDKNPALKGGRFIYSHNNEAYSHCLFYISTMLLKEGTNRLEELQLVLDGTPADFKESMTSNLQRSLSGVGVELVHKTE